MRRLGVVGLVTLDRVDGGLPRLGGAPYYAARALRLLGHPATLATKIADDDRQRLSALEIPAAVGRAERTAVFRIENVGDERTMTLEDPGEAWTPEDVDGWLAPALRGVDVVHAGALTQADFPAETLARLRRGRRVSLDAQGLVRSARVGELVLDANYDPEVLRHLDVLKVSSDEADVLGLEPDARSLGSLGVGEVLLTLGPRGVVVYAEGVVEHVPAHPVETEDATGAGDAFIAAYLSFRLRKHAPRSAARLAADVVHSLLSRWRGR
jgi:sugar/nucleoside kinase (ribokinase family)